MAKQMMDIPTQRTVRRGVKGAVSTYFHKRPGQSVFINDLMQEIGCTATQIQGAISNIMRQDEDHGIQTVVRGREWVYKPAAKKAEVDSDKKMWIEVGKTRSGSFVAEDEEGILYKVTELDL